MSIVTDYIVIDYFQRSVYVTAQVEIVFLHGDAPVTSTQERMSIALPNRCDFMVDAMQAVEPRERTVQNGT